MYFTALYFTKLPVQAWGLSHNEGIAGLQCRLKSTERTFVLCSELLYTVSCIQYINAVHCFTLYLVYSTSMQCTVLHCILYTVHQCSALFYIVFCIQYINAVNCSTLYLVYSTSMQCTALFYTVSCIQCISAVCTAPP